MANDYSSLGFCFTKPEDVLHFTNEHSDEVESRLTKHGTYGLIRVGPKIELWFYGNGEYLDPLSVELWHCSGRSQQLTDCEWLYFGENHVGAFLLNGFLDNTGFPLNVDIVNGCEFSDCTDFGMVGKSCEVDFTLFARRITVYVNEDTFDAENFGGMAAESCIPCGAFPVDGDNDFEPSATALLNGVVRSAHHLANPATGLSYWCVTLDCMGTQFDAVIADDLVETEIETGNVIAGYYWLSGKLLRRQ